MFQSIRRAAGKAGICAFRPSQPSHITRASFLGFLFGNNNSKSKSTSTLEVAPIDKEHLKRVTYLVRPAGEAVAEHRGGAWIQPVISPDGDTVKKVELVQKSSKVKMPIGSESSLLRRGLLTESGKIYVQGSGNLGLGTGVKDVPSFRELPAPLAKDLCMMESYSALVTQDGDVYTWGEGGSTWSPGPLGHGDYEDVWKPKKVENLPPIKAIACSTSHIIALSEDGSVYTWGLGEFGRLGHASSSSLLTPQRVESFDEPVLSVYAGSNFSMAITSKGLYSWGRNEEAQLGVSSSMLFDMYAMESSPALVEFPEEITLDDTQAPSVLAVSKAKKRALAYFADTNRLYAWGAKLWVIPTYQPIVSNLIPGPILSLMAAERDNYAVGGDRCLYRWVGNDEPIPIPGFGDVDRFGLVEQVYGASTCIVTAYKRNVDDLTAEAEMLGDTMGGTSKDKE